MIVRLTCAACHQSFELDLPRPTRGEDFIRLSFHAHRQRSPECPSERLAWVETKDTSPRKRVH